MSPAVLDAAAFPHLIDLIFEYAPLDSLMALRINRAWTSRANGELGYHLTISETKIQFYRTPSYNLHSAKGSFGTLELDKEADGFVPTFFRSAAVIDLRAPAFKGPIRSVLQEYAPNATYRCNALSDLPGKRMHPPCIVLFAEYLPEAYVQRPIAFIGRHRHELLQGCAKLVLHSWPEQAILEPLGAANLGGVGSFSIIVHLYPVNGDNAVGDLMKRRVFLGDHMMLGWRESVPTTVVVVDEPELEEDYPQMGSVKNLLRRWCVQERRKYTRLWWAGDEHQFSTPEEEAETPGTRYLTSEEYCAEVGQDQFDLEMDPGPLARPRSARYT